jgi:DNA end-binding protein Ku
MARALWKGAISFGLVHVPVELHPASQTHDLDLDLLDRRTLDPVGYRRYNKSTGEEVPWAETVKGYAYQDGQYVLLGDEDFRQANPKASQTVEIVSFVKEDEIPPTFFETPYYLVPAKRGEKGYALLREAMAQSGRVGFARVVIRTRQHLAVVMPQDDILLLNTLRYADEIRTEKEFELPHGLHETGVSDKELKMALKLVEDMTEAWQPSRYEDTFRADILARIEAKVAAGEAKVVATAPDGEEREGGAQVIDLMALLQRSLKKSAGEKAETAPRAGMKKVARRQPAKQRSGRKRS